MFFVSLIITNCIVIIFIVYVLIGNYNFILTKKTATATVDLANVVIDNSWNANITYFNEYINKYHTVQINVWAGDLDLLKELNKKKSTYLYKEKSWWIVFF